MSEFIDNLINSICKSMYQGLWDSADFYFNKMNGILLNGMEQSKDILTQTPSEWNSAAYSFIKITVSNAVIPIAACFLTFIFALQMINMVKESSPADYPDRTYGEAFENFFDDPVWQYLEDDGEKYIWFLGQCQVNGQVSNCEVHFQLDLENGRFRVVYYEVDGKEKPLENWPSVLATIFETE